jgi:hypothetical protein
MGTNMNILLGVATLITLLVFGLTVGTKMPSGPDRAGIGFMWLLLTVPRWISLAIVLYTLAQRDAFAWFSSNRAVQTLVVLALHAVMGVVVLIAVGAAADNRDPNVWLRAGCWMVAYGIPLAVILYLAALVNPGSLPIVPLQWIATASAGICIAIAATFAFVNFQQSLANENAAAALRAQEQDQYYQERLAQFEALPKDGPLGPFLHFIHNEPGDIQQRANKVIQSRANFNPEFAQLLENEYTQEAMTYLITELPNPSAELAAPAANAVRQLASRTARSAAARPASYDDEYGYECRLGVQVADRFPAQSRLFIEPLQNLLQAVSAPGDPKYASAGRAEIRSWLRRHAN